MAKKKFKINKKSDIVVLLFGIICLIVAGYSLFHIITWKQDLKENDKIKSYLNDNIFVIDSDNENIDNIAYSVDFSKIKDMNSDSVAYLQVNNTNIDYVVVKGKDNNYYLKHNFEKKYNVAGWVFADYHNRFDETDKNIIIYGHNIKDGSMFGSLINTLDKEWYLNEDNYLITLVTDMGTYYYQVFSVYSIVPEDYYINTIFNSDDDFNKFVNVLKKRSIYDFGVDVSGEDKILTLSSCIGDGSKRVVLHSKLVEKA